MSMVASPAMMSEPDVQSVVATLTEAGIRAWVDGGWGIDALLERQTRPHEDLDLVISLADITAATKALGPKGFAVGENENNLPTMLVMRDAAGRIVDFHPVTFDDEGNGWQQLPDGKRFNYDTAGLSHSGMIGDMRVRCLSPELQVRCHTGYEPDADDCADMKALAEKYGLVLPTPYA